MAGSTCPRRTARLEAHRDHPAAHGRRRGQEPARWVCRLGNAHLSRPEPLRHAAGGDRFRARHPHAGRGLRIPDAARRRFCCTRGVSDCNMEEGSLRCDANVSVRLKGAEQFGTKAEVKNVNSFRFVRAALEYEIERQIEVIESGGRVTQESRLWNAERGPHLLHALKGAGARLSLFSRAGSAAAGCFGGISRTQKSGAPGVAGSAARADDRRVRVESARTPPR